MHFDGESYEPELDQARLTSQLERVKALMQDGHWRTLGALSAIAGGSEASVSARLRDLRKTRFGAYSVDRRRVEGGLFEYRVIPKEPTQGLLFGVALETGE